MGHTKDLELEENANLELSTDAFGSRMNADKKILEVPARLAEMAERYFLRTCAALIAYVRMAPGCAEKDLEMSATDVQAALASLIALLRGNIADDFLDPRPPLQVGTGLQIKQ